MQKLFNNILLPVDFSNDSKGIFEKAIDLANKYDCHIHLLYVATISSGDAIALAQKNEFVLLSILNKQEEFEYRLEGLKNKYKDQLTNGRSIYTHLQRGTWEECIIQFVLQNKIDLVIAGFKNKVWNKKNLFDPNKIAEKVNIPVITIPQNRRLVNLISVVIPITDFLPVKKLMYGIYVAQNDNATIRLLGVEDQSNPDQSRKVNHYLQKSFQLVRDNCAMPVEIATTAGRNVVDAINQYSYKNPMDLIIVNPDKQRTRRSLASFLGNLIQRVSAPPVLTISHV